MTSPSPHGTSCRTITDGPDISMLRWFFELGRNVGRHEGYAQAEQEMAAAWAKVAVRVRRNAEQPDAGELIRRRYSFATPARSAEQIRAAAISSWAAA